MGIVVAFLTEEEIAVQRGYMVNCESMKTKIYRADTEFKAFMYSLRNSAITFPSLLKTGDQAKPRLLGS